MAPVTFERAFENLEFHRPILVTFPPDGSNRIAVVEQAGTIFIFPNDPNVAEPREFFLGLYETALAPGDVLAAVEFEAIRPGYRSAFLELARRHGDYAIVGLAPHASTAGGTFSDVRLAYLGAGGTPGGTGSSPSYCQCGKSDA